MTFVPEFIPEAEEAIELPVDELALRLLRLLAKRDQHNIRSRYAIGRFTASTGYDAGGSEKAFLKALVEAWDWLEHHGLLAVEPGDHDAEWAYITRKGEAFLADSNPLALVRAEARIDVDLHPLIATTIRRQFLLGEYEAAALLAMKKVEIRVRELADASPGDIGVNLMKHAFAENGPLADPSLEPAEQQATMALFWGAIGVFKNPSSHREVVYDDATFASEVVLLADLLLRMLDRLELYPLAGQEDSSA